MSQRNYNIYIAFLIIVSMLFGQENTDQTTYDLGQKMSIKMKDSDIRNVLGLIGELTGLNIVITPDVQDTVTADLEDVTVRAALDAILEPNGYSYFIRENIIIIKQAGTRMVGELHTEIVKLKYIDAEGLSDPLGPIFTNLGTMTTFNPLSTSGGNSNIVIITDIQDNMDRIKSMIELLDKPIPNINIAVKFIETQLDTQKGTGGLDWTSQPLQWGSLADSVIENMGGLGVIPFSVNNMTIATLNPGQLLNTLRIMEARGNSKLLSSPSVTTLDNQAATTQVTTSVYIQGSVNSYNRGRNRNSSSQGMGQTNNNVSQPAAPGAMGTNIYQGDISNMVTERNIGISLTVTPRLNGVDQITLTVDASVEALLASSEVQSDAPRSTNRSVSTQVTVTDGDTVILGGLIAENLIENMKYVPILSGLPFIGRLFKTRSIEKEQRELLIFITPNVVG